MSWNLEHIDDVAVSSAPCDYWAFELVGISEIPNASVLDVGCFDGFNTVLKFAPYDNISRVVGIDSDKEAIEIARSATDDCRFQWSCVDFEDFDGEDDSFDVVYFSHTFQHMDDKDAVLAKARSLLKEDGCLIVKTVDDSMKVSAPDPEGIMAQVLAKYESEIVGKVPHTCHTDRNCGSKMQEMLVNAGFNDVSIKIFHSNTSEMAPEERLRLFERMTYFRNPLHEGIPQSTHQEMEALLESWQGLFEDPAYFFSTATVMAVASKNALRSNRMSRRDASIQCDGFDLAPMSEDDLGEVMVIETRSFSDPWTPVAYAMELRHNPDARYIVARSGEGDVKGYIGWWNRADGSSVITHVATDPQERRSGVGTALVNAAKECARDEGCSELQLTVRSGNQGARGFYEALGFIEVGVFPEYYKNPMDDGLLMALGLEDPR